MDSRSSTTLATGATRQPWGCARGCIPANRAPRARAFAARPTGGIHPAAPCIVHPLPRRCGAAPLLGLPAVIPCHGGSPLPARGCIPPSRLVAVVADAPFHAAPGLVTLSFIEPGRPYRACPDASPSLPARANEAGAGGASLVCPRALWCASLEPLHAHAQQAESRRISCEARLYGASGHQGHQGSWRRRDQSARLSAEPSLPLSPQNFWGIPIELSTC
jgi:hypothetical protein